MTEEENKPFAPFHADPHDGRLFRFIHHIVHIVTGQKSAEVDVTELARFPEKNPNPVLRAARDGTLLYANPASADLLTAWCCQIGQPLPAAWHEHVLAVLASGVSGSVETAVAQRIFSLVFVPLTQEDCVNIYGTDITDYRYAEERRAYKALLLANVHDAVVGTDDQLRVTYWNKAAEEMFGWSEQEALGQEAGVLFKTKIIGSSREVALDKLMTLGRHDGEAVYTRKDGFDIQAHVRSTVLRDAQGEFAGLVSTIRDITARKQAEEALRLSEERFAKAFHSSPVAIIMTRNKDDRIVDVNEAWSKLLGYTREQAVGRTPAELKIIAVNYRQQVVDLGESPDRLQNVEASITTYTGEIRTILFSMDLLDIRGESHTLTTFTDITERKRAQQQALDLTLERERMQLLASFVQDAAHEFRTPLAVISTLAFVMARLPEEEKRRIRSDTIQAQVQRITKLVDMLLLMTRLDSGVMAEQSPVDVDKLVKAVCQKAIAQYGEEPALHYASEPDLPQVMGDADMLLEAFWQVLDNAYRNTPASGGVNVFIAAVSGHIRLVIADTGKGISSADLPSIFKTFWRQDKARTQPGFGLGLSIVQKIVERHEGKVEVTSEVDVGTTVTITLPVLH